MRQAFWPVWRGSYDVESGTMRMRDPRSSTRAPYWFTRRTRPPVNKRTDVCRPPGTHPAPNRRRREVQAEPNIARTGRLDRGTSERASTGSRPSKRPPCCACGEAIAVCGGVLGRGRRVGFRWRSTEQERSARGAAVNPLGRDIDR
ncbi:hypothetical protein C8Q77DRAFT_349323 [Trametes polyzona]|nr:hypothetical protein C8Q77DRAFT_349323 [Trametes polyzona]